MFYRPDFAGPIVVIANSTSILSKELGKKIDSFPMIVRLGNFVIKDYEKYIGSRTDICSTIWHNFQEVQSHNCEKYILVNHGDSKNTERAALIENVEKLYIPSEKVLYTHKRGDDDEIKKFFYEYMDSSIPVNNFSLGFRTLFILKKLFPKAKIYVHGFDFFKTGYYSNSSHNIHRANMHPYIYERACLKKLTRNNVFYEL